MHLRPACVLSMPVFGRTPKNALKGLSSKCPFVRQLNLLRQLIIPTTSIIYNFQHSPKRTFRKSNKKSLARQAECAINAGLLAISCGARTFGGPKDGAGACRSCFCRSPSMAWAQNHPYIYIYSVCMCVTLMDICIHIYIYMYCMYVCTRYMFIHINTYTLMLWHSEPMNTFHFRRTLFGTREVALRC